IYPRRKVGKNEYYGALEIAVAGHVDSRPKPYNLPWPWKEWRVSGRKGFARQTSFILRIERKDISWPVELEDFVLAGDVLIVVKTGEAASCVECWYALDPDSAPGD